MLSKLIINIKNNEEIKRLKSYGIINFIAPLKGFCVGYDEVDFKTINSFENGVYLLINRILDKKAIDELNKILDEINNIKGIFFEDLAVLQIIRNKNLNIECIYFPNHFATNYASINAFLKRNIDSVVVSNEITYEEIQEILEKVNKDVVVQILGYNQIMYSRRNLISNFNAEYNLELSKDNKIEEQVTKRVFPIKENEAGTVIFDDKIYNNLELLNLSSHVKFYYINKTYLDIDEVINCLETKEIKKHKNGFLSQKTIYKVGGKNE